MFNILGWGRWVGGGREGGTSKRQRFLHTTILCILAQSQTECASSRHSTSQHLPSHQSVRYIQRERYSKKKKLSVRNCSVQHSVLIKEVV